MRVVARAFQVLWLAFFAVALTACSGGKPESTVEALYRAAEKGDVDKAVEQISFAGVPENQMLQAKGKVQMIVGEMQRRIQTNGGVDKVETLESKVDEQSKTAVVRTRLVFKNGKDVTETHRLVQEDGAWKLRLK
ncbi:hypothetical protein CEG14_01985 [Bordetella genomosp. 1]|uniref:DUF4878 domain-containing protein n=1 Tax=Bordetella genomosp. 1 TaxID=1395607 RepID=A0A261ST42_9BORD|nr:DUF4878 domain-containing protein [Bordetella genomosp. 1]MDQ8031470.1 DUF4878 domain-containing protein [Bordetella sp.]OZI40554.1 hypothetical protein CEG14_01985 [Bordetella genomosp. 1]OZI68748.1 hypothetical protein CAL27_04625 [Bordetella genomosp. 1]